MKSTIRFVQADHGPQVRAAIGVLAIAVAMTYTLGYLTGQWVHNLNDSMAGFRLDTAAMFQPAPRPAHPAYLVYWESNALRGIPSGSAAESRWRGTVGALTPAMIQQRHAAATLPTLQAPALESLTVAELRKLARSQGHRKLARSGRRADLLQVLA